MATGFTLLEVLVATVIAGLVFAAALPVTSAAMRRIGDDRGELVATEVAQSVLARVGHDIPLADGSTAGSVGKVDWTVRIAPWTNGVPDAPSLLEAHTVDVTVAWPGWIHERELRFSTLRLEPRR